MLVNAVIYTFPADKAEAAAELLVALARASRAESGCRRFDVGRSNDDPAIFVLLEEWVDEAALAEHFRSPHFIEFGANGIRPLALSRVAHQCTPLLA